MAGLSIDHIALAADDLGQGAALIEARLGLPMDPGGRHPQMGTWNRLLSLGPDCYLEAIAVDPHAEAPPHPRFFDLDGPPGPARLGVVLADPGLAHATHHRLHPMSRGDLAWTFAQHREGGMQPGLIDWGGPAPVAGRLPDRGLRLVRVTIPALTGLPPLADPRIVVDPSADRITAVIDTPAGPRSLP